MLLSLIGLVFGVVACALIGTVVLALHPRWKLTFPNIVWFVVGAFTGAIGSSLLYTWLVANETRTLQSSAAVFGYLLTLGITTVLGGTLALFLAQRHSHRSE